MLGILLLPSPYDVSSVYAITCISVSAAGQDHSLVLYGANALAATAGELTIKQAAQEVAVATVSAALIAGGVSTVVAPVVAVVIVVGHVIIRGATRYVYKKVRVRADQRSHVEQLHLNQAEPPDNFTMIINGNWVDGKFNAFLSPNDNASYTLVDPRHLHGLSKLIGGGKSCNVRDMGGFTTGAKKPFSIRLSMPDVLSLIRQSWEYEKFATTNDGTMTVIFIRAKKRSSTKLRIAWQNSGPLDSCQAMIFTEKEWKSSKFSKKTNPMPDGFADVDVALDRSLVFV